MTAAALFAPVSRHDLSCAFCLDGEPVERFRGKAGCERCIAAIREAYGHLEAAQAKLAEAVRPKWRPIANAEPEKTKRRRSA